MNDKEILTTLCSGNEKAFEMIYNRFHTSIFFIVQNRVIDADLAKDIRSVCFMRLWENKDTLSFDSIPALFGWLKKIALNLCTDHTRHEYTKAVKETDIICYYNKIGNPDIFELTDKEAIVLDRMLERIDRLPDKVKMVFKMRWLHDLKFREIAYKLDTNVSTVKKRHSRALQLLNLKAL